MVESRCREWVLKQDHVKRMASVSAFVRYTVGTLSVTCTVNTTDPDSDAVAERESPRLSSLCVGPMIGHCMR